MSKPTRGHGFHHNGSPVLEPTDMKWPKSDAAILLYSLITELAKLKDEGE